MPAGAEAPAPALYVDRQGHGHFDLGPGAADAANLAPTAQKSVLDLIVDDSPPLAAPRAVLDERAGAGAGMAVALRDAAAQVGAPRPSRLGHAVCVTWSVTGVCRARSRIGRSPRITALGF